MSDPNCPAEHLLGVGRNSYGVEPPNPGNSNTALPVDRSPNPTTCCIPGPVRPMMPNGIRIRSAVFHNALDRPTDAQTDRSSTGKFDYRPLRYNRATRPNNAASVGVDYVLCFVCLFVWLCVIKFCKQEDWKTNLWIFAKFSPMWASGCKNRACSVSRPEVVKYVPNQGVLCFVSYGCFSVSVLCLGFVCSLVALFWLSVPVQSIVYKDSSLK